MGRESRNAIDIVLGFSLTQSAYARLFRFAYGVWWLLEIDVQSIHRSYLVGTIQMLDSLSQLELVRRRTMYLVASQPNHHTHLVLSYSLLALYYAVYDPRGNEFIIDRCTIEAIRRGGIILTPYMHVLALGMERCHHAGVSVSSILHAFWPCCMFDSPVRIIVLMYSS